MYVPGNSLATVVKVVDLEPISGADKIELATVLNWKVVVKKDTFKIGDLAVYFATGSVLETAPYSDFLPKNSLNICRPLKTVKIRGVYSQGLLIDLQSINKDAVFVENEDLTSQLNVRKFIEDEEASVYENAPVGDNSPFPDFLPKTDESNIQSSPKILAALMACEKVVITLKFDGQSITICVNNGEFMICSRNFRLLKPTPNSQQYFDIVEKSKLSETLPTLKRNLAIQGELIGPKINSGRHKTTDNQLHVFNIYDIDTGGYLPYDEMVKICQQLNLSIVPVVYQGPLKDLRKTKDKMIDVLLKLADDQKYPTGTPAEGIVIKSLNNQHSCKVISNRYRLKNNLC